MQRTSLVLALLLPTFGLFGCAATLEANGITEDSAGTGGRTNTASNIPAESGNFRHSVDDDGVVVSSIVDAGDYEAWQSLDLDTGRATEDDTLWDLGFQRFHVRTNGGVTGTAGVQIVALPGTTFESVTVAPEEGWTVDHADGDGDEDTLPDNAFNDGVNDWYDYDVTTHTLTAKDITYVIASSEERFFKLRIEDYYDDAGTPAILSFRWAEIDAPAAELPDHEETPPEEPEEPEEPEVPEEPVPDTTYLVDASSPQTWVYVKAGVGVVDIASPETDLGWDLALCRTAIRTNSGTSGAGLGGARLDETDSEFASLTKVATFGFEEDTVFNSGVPGATDTSGSMPLSNWYDYDGTTHAVTAGARTYAIRTASGDYAKLRFWSWNNGKYELSLDLVERDTSAARLSVDASAEGAWTYVSLRKGQLVTVSSPSSDVSWDLGFSRTLVRTNSGTSGGGNGGAVLLSATSLAGVTKAPTSGFVIDANLNATVPVAQSYSGNQTVASWFAFDAENAAVSVKPNTVFGVHTAEGGFSAVQIETYSAGSYVLAVRYAGPGHTDL